MERAFEPMEKVSVLEFKDLYLDVINMSRKSRHRYIRLISGVSGRFVSGELTALMGGSGSGKTSLINMIAGRIERSARTSGSITLNSRKRDVGEWLRRLAYLEQFDKFLPYLTVEETIRYSALFRRSDLNVKVVERKVEEIMERLDLTRIRGTLMRSISGGESKRCMAAVELIVESDIIFLDEPTTGLDSHLALDLIKILREYARANDKIVVVSVHQPGDGMFGLFDNLLFLQSGRTFYNGPAAGLRAFFAQHGLYKPSELSMSEYLFELHARKPALLSPGEFRAQVSRIHEENDARLRDTGGMWRMRSTQRISLLLSSAHVKSLLVRHLVHDWRSRVMLYKLLFKMGVMTVLFYFCYKRLEFSINSILKGFAINISEEGFVSTLQSACNLRGEFTFETLMNVLALLAPSFFLPFYVFNDSTMLDYKEVLIKESNASSYSQASLYTAAFIYEALFSLIRTLHIALLFYTTQLRPIVTLRFLCAITLLPMAVVLTMLLVKCISINSYPVNIARVALTLFVTILRTPYLSTEFKELEARYSFMKHLYPLSYIFIFMPFFFLDSYFFVTVINEENKDIARQIIHYANTTFNFNIIEIRDITSALNRHLVFFNRHCISNGGFLALGGLSALLVVVFSIFFLIFNYNPRLRLELSDARTEPDEVRVCSR
jgi:ATP-binding cassette, subfamily G (WHITE), member 1